MVDCIACLIVMGALLGSLSAWVHLMVHAVSSSALLLPISTGVLFCRSSMDSLLMCFTRHLGCLSHGPGILCILLCLLIKEAVKH